MKEVTKYGGEGVMLRKADSHYQKSRSSSLLKVKTFSDAEAVVVGHEMGKGRLAGLVGALIVENSYGKRFKVGSG